MGTGGPFPGGGARPGRDADHSPPSGAEVVNEWELYLLSPQALPWRVEGLLYFTLLSKREKIKIHKTIIFPVVLYGCKTLVSSVKVLIRVSGPKWMTAAWRKLHNEARQNLYSGYKIK
jgi:hypothetical protein